MRTYIYIYIYYVRGAGGRADKLGLGRRGRSWLDSILAGAALIAGRKSRSGCLLDLRLFGSKLHCKEYVVVVACVSILMCMCILVVYA